MRRTVMPDHSVDKVLQGAVVISITPGSHTNLQQKLTLDNSGLLNLQAVHKVSKVSKAKGQTSGRTYTSKYRGVHQTFPTKRWEAQFRCDCLAAVLSVHNVDWVTVSLAALPCHSSLQIV